MHKRTTFPRHTAGALATLIAAAIGLAGCGVGPIGSNAPERAATPPEHAAPPPGHPVPSKTGRPAEGTLSTPAYDVKTPPGTSAEYVGALKDTTMTRCTSRDDDTDVVGTVTNPTDRVQDYRIYVSVLANSTTIGLSEADMTVKAGKTADWSAHLKAGDPAARCVLRVERNRG